MTEFLRLEPEKLAHELSERGLTWADENAAAEALEEAKPTLLAQIATQHLEMGESAAKAELFAKGSQEYAAHLAGMVEARRMANRARVSFDVYRAYVELLRSRASTERAAMTMR